jgi:hypothetical protein
MDKDYNKANILSKYSMFPSMAHILQTREGERFRLERFLVQEEDVKGAKIYDLLRGNKDYEEFVSGTYLKLYDKELEEVVMSDTPMEKKTNKEVYDMANGNVLIGGLGIGMILLALQSKPEVKTITVIEKYKEVIDLVSPQLPLNEKVTIINEDIFNWIPSTPMRYDTIYLDIWNEISGEDYKEHKKLRKKYSKILNNNNSKCWMGCWREKDVKDLYNRSL